MKTKKIKRAMLVYQAGIANVFAVDCFNLSTFGRNARLLIQSSFRTCVSVCQGLAFAGVIVRTAACNSAGSIENLKWTDNLDEQPFSDKIVDFRAN